MALQAGVRRGLRTGIASVRSRLAAGVLDAGLSSVATFATGIYASRFLDPHELGGYALIFSATVVSAILPTQLIFVPAETAAVAQPMGIRRRLLLHTSAQGIWITLVAALLVPGAAVVVPGSVPRAAVYALAMTATLNAFVTPIQDHVRRMLHVAGLSWWAAAVSALRVLLVILTIVGAPLFSLPGAWVPFGALAVGNALSILLALAVAMRADVEARSSVVPAQALVRGGGWLLIVGLLAPATAFIVGSIVAHVAGAESLGYAEACRQVGQPLFVFASGLSSVLGPRLTEAAQRHDAKSASHHERAFLVLMMAVSVPYIVLTAHSWTWNPLSHVLPNAYAISGLIAVTLVANLVNGLNFSQRAELLGAGEFTDLARTELAGNVVRTAIAATAGASRSFAIPVGLVALAAYRWLSFSRTLRRYYAPVAERTQQSPVATLA